MLADILATRFRSISRTIFKPLSIVLEEVSSIYANLTNWLSRNLRVHYHPYKSLPLVPIFNKSCPNSRITTHLLQILSSHLHLGLPKGLFPSGFPTKTLYAFVDCSIRATCPAHLSRLDLRFLIMLGEEYNACSSVLCNFLHSPIILSLVAPNIFLSTLFSNTINLCSSLNVRDQVTQSYNAIGNIIVLYVLTSVSWKTGRTIKFSQVNNNTHFPCLF